MQPVAIVVSLTLTLVAVAMFARAAARMVAVIALGAPDRSRSDQPARRWVSMLTETVGHTRMLQWTKVGVAHWFVFVGFGALFFTLVTAYGQIFSPSFTLPLIGHWVVFEWGTELIAWATLLGIAVLIGIRLANLPAKLGRASRFTGSTMWQGYFVEWVIVVVALCVLSLRGLEYALARHSGWSVHYPLTWFIGTAFSGASTSAIGTAIVTIAAVKIAVSMTWFLVLALNLTMGVAWHRFLVFVNVWFRRDARGGTALGRLEPIRVNGEPVDLSTIEDLDEDAALGAGKIEDFSWKGLLDFSTCTECGRCQSQCPAWNTGKPLSPKLVVLALREHLYAKAPALLAARAGGAGSATGAAAETGGAGDEAGGVPAVDFGPEVAAELSRPLVGDPQEGGVIDPEALWACTTCGACVQQCPVDIEHVDHIVSMRRHQVLLESAYPSELGGLFKNLEKAGNPWGVPARDRMAWAEGLDFPVKVVGEDVSDLSEVEWLFWVGCAGAFEDRAKKTTRAVAELLHTAGVSFAVLGTAETCTGDPARRSGNEFLFQMLAAQAAETLSEAKATKVVATCAHCFNTLANEYAELGVTLEVVHHTQLLNRLVRDGRLTPVAPVAPGLPLAPGGGGLPLAPAPGAAPGASGLGLAPAPAPAPGAITYHDPCYIGRHNGVYSPPRELIGALPGVELREMPRSFERSFCCGAGGARMWMEEQVGTRINATRTAEAVATGARQIAVACPFCRVMLSDGLTAAQAEGSAPTETSVVDVAQLLLEAVRRSDPGGPGGPVEPVAVG